MVSYDTDVVVRSLENGSHPLAVAIRVLGQSMRNQQYVCAKTCLYGAVKAVPALSMLKVAVPVSTSQNAEGDGPVP